VGVCWHEATAFARWVGKRLPSDAEWTKAGAWPILLSSTQHSQRKYPWGETMDRRRANLVVELVLQHQVEGVTLLDVIELSDVVGHRRPLQVALHIGEQIRFGDDRPRADVGHHDAVDRVGLEVAPLRGGDVDRRPRPQHTVLACRVGDRHGGVTEAGLAKLVFVETAPSRQRAYDDQGHCSHVALLFGGQWKEVHILDQLPIFAGVIAPRRLL